MSSLPTPSDRLRRVCAVAPLRPSRAPVRLESYSNDVWRIMDADRGPVVLRVAWRGDIDRLKREVEIGRHLPSNIRYPEVLGHGRTMVDDFPITYSLTRCLTGCAVADGWAALSMTRRRSAVGRLADMLRELHAWRPPADLADLLCRRAELPAGGISALVGADLNPLPIERTLRLARHVMTMPFIDPGLLSRAIEMIEELRDLEPALDDPAQHGLIHGDLQLSNLWRSESGEVVLLDLEWVRFAPPLLDIQRLCENADIDQRNGNDTNPAILRLLAADYPELFQGARAADRMRLYSLAYSIRHIIVDPPNRPADQLGPDHSLNRVRRLVEGRWPAPGSPPELLVPENAVERQR